MLKVDYFFGIMGSIHIVFNEPACTPAFVVACSQFDVEAAKKT